METLLLLRRIIANPHSPARLDGCTATIQTWLLMRPTRTTVLLLASTLPTTTAAATCCWDDQSDHHGHGRGVQTRTDEDIDGHGKKRQQIQHSSQSSLAKLHCNRALDRNLSTIEMMVDLPCLFVLFYFAHWPPSKHKILFTVWKLLWKGPTV